MDQLITTLKQKAKDLLTRGEVTMILGFTKGNRPMVTRPYRARSPEEVDRLWWDDFCVMNLANFLPRNPKGKTGVLMKACDLRSLVILDSEKRINLQKDFYVIEVPCRGMVDAERALQRVPAGKPIDAVNVFENQIEISSNGTVQTLERSDLLRTACRTCKHTAPDIANDHLSTPQTGVSEADMAKTTAEEEKTGDFNDLFTQCIQCFACREACPSCYCDTCFADKAKQLWQGPAVQGEKEPLDFHTFRAYHMLGRCTDCGACESACPVNIPVRQLIRHLKKRNDAFKEFEPGLNPAMAAPDVCFCPAIHEHQK